jgi:hypothetical protein
MASYQTSDFFLVDSMFTLNATSFLLIFYDRPFFSKNISGISYIKHFFSHISDILAKLKKQLAFSISIFGVGELQQIVNYKLYKKVRTSCMFSFHDIARFFPLIIVVRKK